MKMCSLVKGVVSNLDLVEKVGVDKDLAPLKRNFLLCTKSKVI